MIHFRLVPTILLAFSFTVIGVSVTVCYTSDINAAKERMNTFSSKIIETHCGRIEYARAGEGDPVLVVHGTMGGVDQGLLVAKSVMDAGYEAISISRFGYLGTPLPENATLDMQAEAYACLLDELGIDRAAVFTFSGGATSAIRFTARYPERVSALILLAPAAPGRVVVPPPPRVIFDTLMRSDFLYLAIITSFRSFGYQLIGVPRNFPLTPEDKAMLDETLATTLPLSVRLDGFIYDNYDPKFNEDFYGSIKDTSPFPLKEIETPVLMIGAEDDPYSNIENVRGMAGLFPNSHLVVLPDGGHPHLGHEEEVATEIASFLNKYTATPGHESEK